MIIGSSWGLLGFGIVIMRASKDFFGMSPICIIWLKDLHRCGVGESANVLKYSLQ